MSSHTPFTQEFDALPHTLPIFPLADAVVLPFGHLPLNIFEPRYLNMVEDALSSHRLIGMIQPAPQNDLSPQSPGPSLSLVGCAARVVRYEETRDGRLEILLRGLIRFQVAEELASIRGYRLVRPDWSAFQADMAQAQPPAAEQILLFRGVLRQYLSRAGLEIDAQLLDNLTINDLLNSLISVIPLDPINKQLLLEASALENRLSAFTAILQEGSNTTVAH